MLTERMKALACNLYGVLSVEQVPSDMLRAMEVAHGVFLKLCHREPNNSDMIPVCLPWLLDKQQQPVLTEESVQEEAVVLSMGPALTVTNDAVSLDPALPPRKRGGRPAGSKNKPKAVSIQELEVTNV